MKKKKLTKGLTLNKSTISNLEGMEGIKGGFTGGVCTAQCQTFDLSNCQTWEFPICQPCTNNSVTCP